MNQIDPTTQVYATRALVCVPPLRSCVEPPPRGQTSAQLRVDIGI